MVLKAASSLSRALTAFAWDSKLMVADPAVSTGVPESGTPAVTVLTAPSWISSAVVVALVRAMAMVCQLQIGSAHVGTPVTNAHIVCRALHETPKLPRIIT